MGTDPAQHQALLAALQGEDWSSVLKAVSLAGAWAKTALVGDPMLDEVAGKLAELASHPKWEVRRAVANVAAHVEHPAFEPALARLASDDNGRVRQAAQQATLRRRDSRNASALGKQHAGRVNATLDDVEARFGLMGRQAVRRAAEQIADMFARELYHEVIRLLSPLAMSAERLRGHLSEGEPSHEAMRGETVRIERRVEHLRAVLGAMRAYTEQPSLRFGPEGIRELVVEAAGLVRLRDTGRGHPAIDVHVPADIVAEVARPRLVQALTNVLENAIDSYDGLDIGKPIVVRAERLEGLVTIVIEDGGCGMSAEARADAVKLFATNKPGGTGFGLAVGSEDRRVRAWGAGSSSTVNRGAERSYASHYEFTGSTVMTNRHRALIVEDDEATVEDLVEVLRSVDCDHVAVASFDAAVDALRTSTFCVILLDLQIKRSPDAIKGHVEHGNALLREIRRIYPEHTGRAFWLPVIVVSGFAREVSAAVDVMKDGAGDVVHKPLKSREVSDAVRRVLEKSGRSTHDQCGPTPPQSVAASSADIRLEIPADRVGRRTRVTVGQKTLELTNGCLKVLLYLIVAHREGKGVHKIDLGAKADQGFKGISLLREALKGALPSGVDIIDNDYHGTYTLTGNVVVGDCDIAKLRAIGDRVISGLADKLATQARSRKV